MNEHLSFPVTVNPDFLNDEDSNAKGNSSKYREVFENTIHKKSHYYIYYIIYIIYIYIYIIFILYIYYIYTMVVENKTNVDSFREQHKPVLVGMVPIYTTIRKLSLRSHFISVITMFHLSQGFSNYE